MMTYMMRGLDSVVCGDTAVLPSKTHHDIAFANVAHNAVSSILLRLLSWLIQYDYLALSISS